MNSHRPTARHAYWAQTPEAVLAALRSTPEGLTETEVQVLLEKWGYNDLPSQRKLGIVRIFFRQFKNPILLILLGAGIVTLALQDWGDSIVILAAVLLNTLLGLYQEAKAENTLALLQSIVKLRTHVIRDGREIEVDARNLVRGDVVRLRQGDSVPADGRWIAVTDVQVDESILTGESLPVEKRILAVTEEAGLADRESMAYSGTVVVQGIGLIVITATGIETELGRIAKLVESAQQEVTPLQHALLKFTYRATLMLGVLTTAMFAYGVYTGRSPLEMFLISVATAVAAVPEGLPVALTVILAIGVDRLARKKGVVRQLLAAETLGSTTIIMTDKTGTLTEAKMELEAVLPLTETLSQEQLLEFAVSHVDISIENPLDAPADWRVTGRPTEVAVVRGSSKFGVHAPTVKSTFEVLERLPFNSTDKYSASMVRGRATTQLVLLGAPEALMARSDMSPKEHELLATTVDELAESGARVLAVASHEMHLKDATLQQHIDDKKAVVLGLLAFRDPVRSTVKDSIARIADSGVRTVLVTGDHLGTAKTVAREVGLVVTEKACLNGADIDALSESELRACLASVTVIARTTPEHKLRIARAFKAMGEVVAMTGDGVNDAPALREADIGISLGTASDVAKAAADLLILDDNFETIVAAVEEGRNILQNVRKVIVFVLCDAFGGLLLIGGSLAAGIALPLTTLQILWINLFTDSFPAMAFAFERNHGDIGKGPVRIGKSIFDDELKFLILGVGLVTSILIFGLYAGLLHAGFDETLVRTFIFASFGVYTLFLAFSVRSLKESIFKYPLFSNRYMVVGTGIGFFMMAAAIYVPQLQDLFHTVPLPPIWVAGVIAVGIISTIGVEFGKWVFRIPRRSVVHV